MANLSLCLRSKGAVCTWLGALGFTLMINPQHALAEYTDALFVDSLITDAAPASLLLDIVRIEEKTVAVGERGHVIISTDQGRSWQQSAVPTRAQINAVSHIGSDLLWAVGEDEIIIHSNDGGASWSRQHDGIDAEQKGALLDLTFTDPKKGFAVGVFNKLFHTADGGLSWQDWRDQIDNLDEWHLFSITATGPAADRLYISSEMGLIFRSVDGGEHFAAIQTPHDGSFHAVIAYRGNDNLDRVVAAGVGGIVYVSEDSGVNWRAVDSGTRNGLSSGVVLADHSILLVGQAGTLVHLDRDFNLKRVYRTEDGLSLSSIVQQSDEQLQMTGFAGISDFEIPQ